MKNIYLLVGPSGSGKSTIAQDLHEKAGLKIVSSYTTRKPRYEGETGHIFISDEEFDALENICGYTVYDFHRYGVTQDIINANDIYIIDPAGVNYMLDKYHGEKGVKIIYINVDINTRRSRMISRGDDNTSIDKRMKFDQNFFFMYNNTIEYDLIVPNYNLSYTEDCILSFIKCCEEVP